MRHFLMAALFALAAPMAYASTLLSDVQVQWTEVFGNGTVTGSALTWGEDAGDGLSAFALGATADKHVEFETPFTIAGFAHLNRAIYFPDDTPDFFGGRFSVTGLFGGEAFAMTLQVDHDETLNHADQCAFGVAPCADIVTLSFVDGPVGVSADFCGSDTFVTAENATNSTNICAVVDAPPAVPLPAGLPLLMAGLGSLAWLRRKKANETAS